MKRSEMKNLVCLIGIHLRFFANAQNDIYTKTPNEVSFFNVGDKNPY